MCGITGFLDTKAQSTPAELEALARRMANTITHRGPDDSGTWADGEAGIALGFRRLAILDLTPTGHQPMVSGDGRFVIVFNGEIYNFGELRQELQALGYTFRGTSDTEVALNAFSQWGIFKAVQRLNGMFAFALWDRRERQLHLVRDRLGIKPLYYGWMGNTLLFGSELKTLRAHPAFQGEIDRNALALYLRHNYIPAPYSIYKNVFKLSQGTILTISSDQPDPETKPVSYWSAREAVERGISNPFTGSEQEAIAEMDALLRESVRLRMIADVPLGAFLSGGIDSSTVVALMQAQSNIPVKTFTIGFYEQEYNEAIYAKAVAQHLGTDHTELYVTPQEAMDVIPRLPRLYDEPFSDSSQIPTFLVSELTRRYVTVSLSGDGGDELFAGYTRYPTANQLWRQIGWLPPVGRKVIRKSLSLLSPAQWRDLGNALPASLPLGFRPSLLADKAQKLGEILSFDSPQSLYHLVVSHWQNPSSLVIASHEYPTALTDRSQWANVPDFTRWMMYLDLITYLPDDILVKVDRASMGVSLEARVPFLDDHRVVEFAWRIPLSMKLRNGQTKWLLRQVLYQYVPQTLIERPKMGFGVPIDYWLRGPLRQWAEELLDEQRLAREGFFNPAPIRQKWAQHLAGKQNWQYYLWDILMFQAWLAETH
ncbi:MAG: asparagine synthase (glutamine-hydrolyzing) [Anaerolineae bacterium]|nr:asparagine synthase (glutamine-hydrolyzing) [Anaerolineae bacterium]